jgi:hypothetical protein
MLININVYVEINPPSAVIDYEFQFNCVPVKHEIINEFDDSDTGGHIAECLLQVETSDPSLSNQLILKVSDITPQSYIQIRELFLDDIKMDHVLLLISKLKIHEIISGTQLNGRGEIAVSFDMPVWSWWCEHLHSIEVIENQGWRIRQDEQDYQ